MKPVTAIHLAGVLHSKKPLKAGAETTNDTQNQKSFVLLHLSSGLAVTRREGEPQLELKIWENSPNQRWRFVPISESAYRIESYDSDRVLDVAGASLEEGAQVIVWTWNGGPNQQWLLVDLGEHRVRLVSRHSRKVLDVLDDAETSGIVLIQTTWEDELSQQWQILDCAPDEDALQDYADELSSESDLSEPQDEGQEGVDSNELSAWLDRDADGTDGDNPDESLSVEQEEEKCSGPDEPGGPGTDDSKRTGLDESERTGLDESDGSGVDDPKGSGPDETQMVEPTDSMLSEGGESTSAEQGDQGEEGEARKVGDLGDQDESSGKSGYSGGEVPAPSLADDKAAPDKDISEEAAGLPSLINCGNGLVVTSRNDLGQVTLTPWRNDTAQRWKLTTVIGVCSRIESATTGRALTIQGASSLENADIVEWPWSGSTHQQWMVIPVGGGRQKIVSRHTGKVLESRISDRGRGTELVQSTWSNRPTQHWILGDYEEEKERIFKALEATSVASEGGNTAGNEQTGVQLIDDENQREL